MIKTFIFKGIIWNSLLIMSLCENNYPARFIEKQIEKEVPHNEKLEHLLVIFVTYVLIAI